ncbi:MAG: hypothetical protein QOE70_2192 [Chthoniobacter sp.]|jgi:hypothetical protein|nr:hypothetical protein [Chthoniobacter sp.]
MRPLHPSLLPGALALLATVVPVLAQVQDSPPVDLSLLLQELKKIREQQTVQMKQQRQTAMQQIQPAASSAERAVVLWEEAVRATQFDGAPKEGTAFKDWKEKEGEGLSGAAGRNAARLYFNWLVLTMQRDAGTPVKDLLPQVIAYTKDLTADQQQIEALDESIKRDKDLASSGKHGAQRKGNDEQVKKMHDQILRKNLTASPVVQWLKLADFVNPKNWEASPGNLDGIFTQIILPELRVQRDPRVLEYWDMRLKKEADAASKTKLAFDIDKFNTQRRPSLLWSRADDLFVIGQKNRAVGEMFNLIKTYPQHPDVATWIGKLEAVIAPPPPAATSPASPGEAASPGAAPEAVSPGAAPRAPGVVR